MLVVLWVHFIGAASSTDLMRVWDSIRAKTKTPENFGASARRKYQNYYATKQSADVIYNEYRSRREAKEVCVRL